MLVVSDTAIDNMVLMDGDEKLMGAIAAHLEQRHASVVDAFDDEQLEAMLRTGLARARSHGLRRPRSLAAFVTLMFSVGPCFDTQPALAAVLATTGLGDDARMQRLTAHNMAPGWRSAQASCGADDWLSAMQRAPSLAETEPHPA